jgi:hypothetical protein
MQPSNARVAKMKGGRMHRAHKAERALDLDTGAVVTRAKNYKVHSYIPEKTQKGGATGTVRKKSSRRYIRIGGMRQNPSARTRQHPEAATDPRRRIQPEPGNAQDVGSGDPDLGVPPQLHPFHPLRVGNAGGWLS